MKPRSNILCDEDKESIISRNVVAIIRRWKSMKNKGLAISVLLLLSMLFLSLLLTYSSTHCFWCLISKDELSIQGAMVDDKIHDKLEGGLLLAGQDEKSCESRYQLNLFRKSRPVDFDPPSSYLISRLRKYEELVKQCGPNTKEYNKALEDIKHGRKAIDSTSACKYVIYTPFNGLGNRMLTLGATFLYALLTNRALFIGNGGDMIDLFCEPFPQVSWKLPSDFPIHRFRDSFSYEELMQNGTFRSWSLYLNLKLGYGYVENTKNFFCDHDQELVQRIPWLIMTSDLYFLPSLFLIPSFQDELNTLFPQKETVFRHLGAYIFHPSNSVWGLITRYYDAYLAKADEILGIQIRVYPDHSDRKTPSINQTLACAFNENLLPKINSSGRSLSLSLNMSLNRNMSVTKRYNKTIAVSIASLSTSHYEELKNMYWDYATTSGESIAVHQPSHDEEQRFENRMHDSKALAEIYLLSFSDKLMTSGLSTFGYVAQSLGGLRSWILDMPKGDNLVPKPPCMKALSMEPCYHFPPTFYSCQNASRIQTIPNHVPYVHTCEDFPSGLKLYD